MQAKNIIISSADTFEKDVLESALLVVVDFYADWCGPCKMVSPVLEDLANEYAGKVRFVKVDTDQNPELAERFGIMSIPTVMLVRNAKVDDKIIGAAPASVYRNKINAVLDSNDSKGR